MSATLIELRGVTLTLDPAEQPIDGAPMSARDDAMVAGTARLTRVETADLMRIDVGCPRGWPGPATTGAISDHPNVRCRLSVQGSRCEARPGLRRLYACMHRRHRTMHHRREALTNGDS